MKPEFYKTKNQHYWRLKSKNGKIIVASSEGFSSKQAVKRNFNLVCKTMKGIKEQ